MKKKSIPRIYIGTSGWSYEHWEKVFYPEGLANKEHLHFYSHYFSIVEINSTFYHLPSEETIKNWAKQTPSHFIFALKASRFITHQKRLIDFKESTTLFFQRIKPLKSKLGPILFQLPPSFKLNYNRLEEFIQFLPKNMRYCFEFRNPSWYTEEVYDLLKKHNIALCFGDLDGILTPLKVTADFIYLRLHGPKKAYSGSYQKPDLKKWAKKFIEWSQQNKTIYCFFNNDEAAYAVFNALQLKELLGE